MTESSYESLQPIPPNAGGDITPEQTVGRTGLVADLLAELENRSVRIEDPRRMGKTSTLRLLASHSTDEAPIVFVTVQGYSTADEIVLAIARSLYGQLHPIERFAEKFRGFFDKAQLNAGVVKFGAALDRTEPAEKLAQLLGVLSGRFPNGKLVIAVDELPWAVSNIANGSRKGVQGPAAAGAFLQALQRFRIDYPDIRWVLTGSIGFHHVLRLADQTNGVLSGLHSVHCGPLDENSTSELIRRLLAGAGIEPIEPEVVLALVESCDGIPFIAHHLVELLAKRETITPEAAAGVFDKFVYDQDRSNDLTHLLQRLDTYMTTQQAKVAERMLDACATDGTCDFDHLAARGGTERDQALDIVNWLVLDHYLIEEPAGFRWRYDVLRKVWVARRRL